jgi:hypothetical protein
MTTPQGVEDRPTRPLTVEDIPGPKGLPVVGNMFDVPADHQVVTLMEVVGELGPMVRLRTPAGDRYVASGLAMIDDLCDDERFDKLVGDGQKAVRSFGRSAGLFTSDTDDPNWSKAHNILLPNFSQQAMRDYVPMMNDIATQLMQKWERLNPGEPVDVTADMTRLTLDRSSIPMWLPELRKRSIEFWALTHRCCPPTSRFRVSPTSIRSSAKRCGCGPLWPRSPATRTTTPWSGRT